MTMASRTTILLISSLSIALCSSKQYDSEYANRGGGASSGPFGGNSGTGSAGFGGPNSNSRENENGFGRSPFSSMTGSNGGGKAGSPFASASNSGNGKGASPFSGAAAGNGKTIGASPFASALANGGGVGNGAGPFSGAMSSKDSSPFKANMDSSGGMPGVDLSSLMKSGPGGLTGGNFLSGNNSMLAGHDFSKDMNNNGGQFGDMGLGQGQSENKIGIDNSRFDTTAYQQMLQDLFSTDNTGQGIKGMGTPFDGNSYNYNNNGGSYNTNKEASIGSFASTDMSLYTGSSGSGSSHVNTQFHDLQNGQNKESGSTYSSGSNIESSGYNSYSNPFDVHNYNIGSSSSSSYGTTGHESLSNVNKGQSPFSIKNSDTGKSPFSTNSNSVSNNGIGSGSGPFDTSKYGMSNGNSGKHSSIEQNPFDTSKYQASGALSNMMGNQNMATGSNNYNNGLDAYGNVDFGTLSSLSGNDASNIAGGEFSSRNGAGSSYTGAKTGYNSGSESQYKTPFESDNYNNLLDNPFKSDSYFDTTRQNFKLPYETDSNLHQNSYSNLDMSSAGYGGSGYGGASPGGDPFHQGGHSMGGSSSMTGPR